MVLIKLLGYFDVKVLLPLLEIVQYLILYFTAGITQTYPPQAKLYDVNRTYDFVIIGGGAAGNVVANRLTEYANWTVLVIEAGDYPTLASDNPGLSVLTAPVLPHYDFYAQDDGYSSQEQKTKSVLIRQGKVLGGSSSINFLYYVRGTEEEFNEWVELGNPGWDWDNATYYYKKSENFTDQNILNSESGAIRGTEGYLGVSKFYWTEETKPYLKAFEENGRKIVDDINGKEPIGYSQAQFVINNKLRQSSAVAYISPIADRPNLYVLRNTEVKKILITDNVAIGVKVTNDKGTFEIYASKEVILTAGALRSPQILMLSGVGPQKQLEEAGITTIVDSPQVGENLQDHPLVPIILKGTEAYENVLISDRIILANLDKFPVPSIVGRIALDKNQTFNDYQVTAFPCPTGSLFPTLMCSGVFTWNDNVCIKTAEASHYNSFYAVIGLMHPESRGYLRLNKTNPESYPEIYTGYFSNSNDKTKLADSVIDYISVLNSTFFQSGSYEVADLGVTQCKNEVFGSRSYWECFVVNMAVTFYHPVGTCAMGPKGVVDENLKVRGIDRLRVADSSVMPSVVRANTYATVAMIAEKVADLIKHYYGIISL